MHDEDGNAVLKNLSMHRANTEEEALNLLFLGDTNRAIAETPMNLASSRSHCLFTIFVEGRKRGASSFLVYMCVAVVYVYQQDYHVFTFQSTSLMF